MKITESEVIKNGERELIDTITGDLDWTAIETLFRKRHNLSIQDDVEYKNGDIVVHENQVAYKLDFEVRVTLSVLLDRQGNSLDISTAGADGDTADEPAELPPLDDEAVAMDDDSLDLKVENLVDFKDDDEDDPMVDMPAEDGEDIDEDPTQVASKIADMISEINDDDEDELFKS